MAHQRKTGGKWIEQGLRLAIYIRDDFTCIYCHSSENLSLDHILPYSEFGSDDPSNLVTCCMTCNSKRGNKRVSDFAPGAVVDIMYALTKSIVPFHEIAVAKIKIYGRYTLAKNAMMEGEVKAYSKYHQDFDSGREIFDEYVKRNDTVVINLVSWGGSLEVDAKVFHEFGSIFGLALKLADRKRFGKMYEKEQHDLIGYFSQFRIRQ